MQVTTSELKVVVDSIQVLQQICDRLNALISVSVVHTDFFEVTNEAKGGLICVNRSFANSNIHNAMATLLSLWCDSKTDCYTSYVLGETGGKIQWVVNPVQRPQLLQFLHAIKALDKVKIDIKL